MFWFRLFLLSMLLISCGSTKLKIEEKTRSRDKASGIEMWASWIKDKGKKFDLRFHISNTSEKARLIYLKDIRCYRGKKRGRLRHANFGIGERTIDFIAGEEKEFTLVCKLSQKVTTGDFKIQIRKIYDNPEDDGQTKGKQLGKGLTYIIGS